MKHPDQIKCALSGARPETSCFSLDFDLHGCRQSVNYSLTDTASWFEAAKFREGEG
jgi:hypothetical protein